MKFKSDKDVTTAPVNFEGIVNELDDVLNMELEQAVEHLDDLEILHANIEKYGITEPVMHLVGGTLESMSISIADKESCLEGLKEGLKEAGKKVWEVIVKIFAKIIELITGGRAEALRKRCEELLKEDDVKIETAEHAIAIEDLGGILDFSTTKDVIETALGWNGFEHIDKYLNKYDSPVQYGSNDEIVYDSDVEEALKASPLKVAMSYGHTSNILDHAEEEFKVLQRLEGYSKNCLKAAKVFLNNRQPNKFSPDFPKAEELKTSARASNKLVLLMFKDATNKLKVVEAILKFEKSKDGSK